MKYDFAVFGATGLQGRIVAKDLLTNGYSVLLCGRDKSRVKYLLKKHKSKTGFAHLDVENIKGITDLIKKSGANVVVNCVLSTWNLNISRACINAGAHYLDLGSEIWLTKKQFSMNSELQKKGLTFMLGCGSVPGVGNVMLRHAAPKFDSIETIHSGYNWKSNMNKFVVPFSIEAIMEEFMDPAIIVKDGEFVKINPMNSMVYLYPREIGKQKSFSERHPENYTFFRYYGKMGLKNSKCFAGFPKHSFDRIKTLVELGFGSYRGINFHGVKIKPIEFLAEVLKGIRVPKGYKETENLWVHIWGKKDGKKKEIKMECVIHTLKGWEEDYTNIDTGMPCSIMAQMIKKGVIKERGCFAPEGVVPPEYFFKELKRRKMIVYENGKQVN
ncbi:MAG: saccharopine dehydrogenase C-terminal domain-containing protein [Nanoarchaeota archaeon]